MRRLMLLLAVGSFGLAVGSFGLAMSPIAVGAQSSPAWTGDSTLSLSLRMRGWTAVGGPVQGPTLGVRLGTTWWRLRVQADADATTASRSVRGHAAPYLLDGRVGLRSDPLRVGRFALDADAGIARQPFDPSTTWIQRTAAVRTWYGDARGGAWARAGASKPIDVHATPTSTEQQLGAWMVRRGAAFTLAVRRLQTGRLAAIGADSASIDATTCRLQYDPHRVLQQYRTLCPTRLALADVGIGATWKAGDAQIHLFAASRLLRQPDVAVPRESWVGGDVEYAWTESVRFTFGAARRPTDIVRGIPAHQRFALGVRFLPVVRHASRGVDDQPVRTPPPGVVSTLRLAAARTAEIRGDFTDWSPVPLTRGPDGTWLLPPGIAPGVYTVSVRLDGGAWVAPPGLPSTTDGYGGLVGILVIR